MRIAEGETGQGVCRKKSNVRPIEIIIYVGKRGKLEELLFPAHIEFSCRQWSIYMWISLGQTLSSLLSSALRVVLWFSPLIFHDFPPFSVFALPVRTWLSEAQLLRGPELLINVKRQRRLRSQSSDATVPDSPVQVDKFPAPGILSCHSWVDVLCAK